MSLTISPAAIPAAHGEPLTLTIIRDTPGFVDGQTIFVLGGHLEWFQFDYDVHDNVLAIIDSPTVARIVITRTLTALPNNPPPPAYTIYVTETITGSNVGSFYIGVSSFSIVPTTGPVSLAGATVTLTGINTIWTQEMPSTLFTLTGGTGAVLAVPIIVSDTVATASLTAGSVAGTLTITDNSSNYIPTASFVVTAGTPSANDCDWVTFDAQFADIENDYLNLTAGGGNSFYWRAFNSFQTGQIFYEGYCDPWLYPQAAGPVLIHMAASYQASSDAFDNMRAANDAANFNMHQYNHLKEINNCSSIVEILNAFREWTTALNSAINAVNTNVDLVLADYHTLADTYL